MKASRKSMPWPAYGTGDLSAVADLIETIPDAEFDMTEWWLPDGTRFNEDLNKVERIASGQCGCVAGHMARARMFGLHPDQLRADPDEVYASLGRLFAIPIVVAEFVFCADSYWHYGGAPAKAAALRRIRFVAAEKIAANAVPEYKPRPRKKAKA